MTPYWGNTILFRSSQQLPPSPSRTFEWLFELTRRPSRALNSPRALLPELQRYRRVWRARRGGPRTPPSTTTNANLDCAFVENTKFIIRKNFKSQKALFCGQILPVDVARAPASAPGSAVTGPRLPSADILTSSRLVDGGTGGHRSHRRKQMCRSKKLSCRPLSTNPDEFLKNRDELQLCNVSPTRK